MEQHDAGEQQDLRRPQSDGAAGWRGGSFYHEARRKMAEWARHHREAMLAEQTGWGRLYAELDPGGEAEAGTSEYDPELYEPQDPEAGPDRVYVLPTPRPPKRHDEHHAPISIERYLPYDAFGGAGGWGYGSRG